jgi:GAF domain-containing protein
VRQHRVDGETIMREVVLPFNGEVTGALHLAFPEGASVPEEKVSLARVLAGLVGIALANARTLSDRLR